MDRLKGKVALITGAGSGMGAETARLFAEEGCAVVLGDIAFDAVNGVAAELGGQALALDVSSDSAWEAAVQATLDRFGRLDILVNNAGYHRPNRAENLEATDFDRHVDVNQRGVLLGMKAVLATMRSSGGGAIVNIISTVSLRGGAGDFAYRMSKWGARGITRSAAHEFAKDNIRVNAVLPGPIDTPMFRTSNDEAMRAIVVDKTLMKRAGEPREVAYATLFLASDEASYVTGAELAVDGGALA